MEITNKKVMVFGGWGLVGMAICRKMLEENPEELIVLSLREREAKDACAALKKTSTADTGITPYWGNIFVRDSMQGLSRADILENPKYRNWLISDILEDLSEDMLKQSYLFQAIDHFRPHIIVDCVNSATAVAYQDVFRGYYNLKGELNQFKEKKSYSDKFEAEVEKILCTLYIPQLIRHVQILYEAMRRSKTGFYVKIGTSGTGGMGLNIPYTHSEEKPSRTLLSKSAVAGAHSLLLFLMARTPDAPITKEIKPTAAIAWKKIAFGEIKRGSEPVVLYDCPPDDAVTIKDELHLNEFGNYKKLDKVLKDVYVDTGENGIFSYGEFAAISSSGQMELVTPEEIARNVVYEIRGGNTGHDVINALDNATMGPTYRAGVMRQSALSKMQVLMDEHKCDSIAFELLGPPRLSKLLYEAHLLKLTCGTMQNVLDGDLEKFSAQMQELLASNQNLRSAILSIGIPILLKDGVKLLRGPHMKIPAYRDKESFKVSAEAIDQWAKDGWVDLRVSNMRIWQKRIRKIFEEMESIPLDDTSSRFDRDRTYWMEEETINIGKLVGWIFSNEEHGLRMKD
ncbi:short-chain dehydrogenase [candidate division KSB1 bacterium]|nr:short-chain dehydrogenase [candidate division KSB1 bacterium]NIR72822.1 short-chain dehydrogenase [candidate division KSB1 bacterium]NIS26862.1 short-chain dehydrogenase [candidate division KSB1 bacterium]NIT73658.1 short-chain dehydrogenase [candidate division KSB1 bacterium]NIU27529.1 short-chain dehydrogenase [candidate division KSB1 bacterium]